MTSWLVGCTAVTADSPKPADRGIAVVELFTSEGCSSCPPADDAVADLLRDTSGQPVFILAFHVDYWDRIGWKDRFADPAYTARQNDYARALRLNSLYTPQVVVNGRREFVGSDRAALKSSVAQALDETAGKIDAVNVEATSDGYKLQIDASNLPPGTQVHAALVESGLSSEVTAGENRGRKLAHERVVRVFRSAEIDSGTHVSILLPRLAGVNLERASIVVFAQRPGDMKVLAAREVKATK